MTVGVGAVTTGGWVGGTVGGVVATVPVGLVVGLAPPVVVAVGDFTVVGVGLTGCGGGVSVPFTLAPRSSVNDVLRQSPAGCGAWPNTPATVDANTRRPSLVK
jgi:hypothetical protein